jgi:hypothetical protein
VSRVGVSAPGLKPDLAGNVLGGIAVAGNGVEVPGMPFDFGGNVAEGFGSGDAFGEGFGWH